MTGSSIVTPANKRGVYYNVYCSLSCIGFPEMNLYKVKTALVHHIEDDPLYKCKIYNEKNTYNDCIENELEVHSTISCFSFKTPCLRKCLYLCLTVSPFGSQTTSLRHAHTSIWPPGQRWNRPTCQNSWVIIFLVETRGWRHPQFPRFVWRRSYSHYDWHPLSLQKHADLMKTLNDLTRTFHSISCKKPCTTANYRSEFV